MSLGIRSRTKRPGLWRDIWALPSLSCTSMVHWGAKCATVKPCLAIAHTCTHTNTYRQHKWSFCDEGGQRQGRLFTRNIKHDYRRFSERPFSPGWRRFTGEWWEISFCSCTHALAGGIHKTAAPHGLNSKPITGLRLLGLFLFVHSRCIS